MAEWVFHHTTGAFTSEDKQHIAKAMTQIHTSVGLLAFYYHAHFLELPPENIYSAGETPRSHHARDLPYCQRIRGPRDTRYFPQSLGWHRLKRLRASLAIRSSTIAVYSHQSEKEAHRSLPYGFSVPSTEPALLIHHDTQ